MDHRTSTEVAPDGTVTQRIDHPGAVALKELKDYQVAKGDPDVRGWQVYASDGRRIGQVDELLVDTAAMKVRYLDVGLDRDLSAGDGPGEPAGPVRNVLLPIGSAHLDQAEDRVIVDLLHTLIGDLPAYGRGPVSREYEDELRQRFDRGPRDTPERDYYAGDLYDDERFYGPRRRR